MAINVSGTSITFNDSTTQNTAFTGSVSGIYTTMQRFNSPGTFTTPANVTQVQLIIMSGGGGGGGGATSNGGTGGGGIVGAGIYPVSASTPYAVTVGSGGPGGSQGLGGGAPGNTGTTGGASSFGAVLTCNGGNGGNGGTPGPAGSPGNPGTSPLAEISAGVNLTGSPVSGFALSNGGGGGAGGNTFDAGISGGFTGSAGTVIVYF
jgi:hypothetical protein